MPLFIFLILCSTNLLESQAFLLIVFDLKSSFVNYFVSRSFLCFFKIDSIFVEFIFDDPKMSFAFFGMSFWPYSQIEIFHLLIFILVFVLLVYKLILFVSFNFQFLFLSFVNLAISCLAFIWFEISHWIFIHLFILIEHSLSINFSPLIIFLIDKCISISLEWNLVIPKICSTKYSRSYYALIYSLLNKGAFYRCKQTYLRKIPHILITWFQKSHRKIWFQFWSSNPKLLSYFHFELLKRVYSLWLCFFDSQGSF